MQYDYPRPIFYDIYSHPGRPVSLVAYPKVNAPPPPLLSIPTLPPCII